jgi:hypothetical protein
LQPHSAPGHDITRLKLATERGNPLAFLPGLTPHSSPATRATKAAAAAKTAVAAALAEDAELGAVVVSFWRLPDLHVAWKERAPAEVLVPELGMLMQTGLSPLLPWKALETHPLLQVEPWQKKTVPSCWLLSPFTQLTTKEPDATLVPSAT